jgi:predicted DNA-binding transcriptional regulator YafY
VIDEQVQAVIYQCLSENKRAQITYLPRASKEVKEYMISPLALVVRDKLIYLLCTMKEYADIRQLALHRIKTAEITEKEINRPTDFDVDTYIASGAFGILDVVTTMKLVVNFNVDAIAHLTETPISSDQKIEKKKVEFTLSQRPCQIIWKSAGGYWRLEIRSK